MKKILLFALCAGLLSSCGEPKPKVCIINGKVIDRPDSKMVYIAPDNTDFRVGNDYTTVQITPEGTFTDTIEFEHSVGYEITFVDEYQNGSWRPQEFMLEDGVVNFVLHPSDSSYKNTVEGGELNRKFAYLKEEPTKIYETETLYAEYKKLVDDRKAYFSEEGYAWYLKMNAAQSREEKDVLYDEREELDRNGKFLSAKVMAMNAKFDSINKLRDEWLLEELRTNADEAGLARLHSLMRFYLQEEKPLDELVAMFNEGYREKFAQNPTTTKILVNIAALNIKAGQPYVDFTAPDLDGKMVTLSDEIKGKVAVIDLWASWCGPCIYTSTSFIPVWEKYKDKGFTIVGVARENDNTDAMVAAIERHKFPWLNLVELNDRISLWAQYGAGNGGGKVILVDADGKIVDTEFNAATLEAHLEKLL